ncbi:MAG: hypothetical protein HYZ87_05110 [Candidatus Omnitrophica bacterium]|nr:hypothetical protein [Candidatus Omnitrophota bacterium]
MSHLSKKFFGLAMCGLLSVALASSAYAESESSGKSLTGFLKKLFNYPVRATQETGEMTANTLENTGEKVLAKTGEDLATAQVPQAAVQPVVGAAETIGQTVAETVQIPVKAAEEEQPAENKAA